MDNKYTLAEFQEWAESKSHYQITEGIDRFLALKKLQAEKLKELKDEYYEQRIKS